MEPMKILVDEHVIILKVLKVTKTFMDNFKKANPSAEAFLNTLIDFFRVYADQTHHGKEEGIFFKKLKDKPLKDSEKKILSELYQEHTQARNLVAALEKEINSPLSRLKEISELYHRHIMKENTQFFLPTFAYFSKEEKAKMILDFFESDQKVLHELYQNSDQKLSSLIVV